MAYFFLRMQLYLPAPHHLYTAQNSDLTVGPERKYLSLPPCQPPSSPSNGGRSCSHIIPALLTDPLTRVSCVLRRCNRLSSVSRARRHRS